MNWPQNTLIQNVSMRKAHACGTVGEIKNAGSCKTGWNRQGTFFPCISIAQSCKCPALHNSCALSLHSIMLRRLKCIFLSWQSGEALPEGRGCPEPECLFLFYSTKLASEKPCPFAGTWTSLFTFSGTMGCCRPMMCLLWDLVTKTSDSLHCNEIQTGQGQILLRRKQLSSVTFHVSEHTRHVRNKKS